MGFTVEDRHLMKYQNTALTEPKNMLICHTTAL